MKVLKITLTVFILVALIFAAKILIVRHNAEKANSNVEITLDYGEVMDLCAMSSGDLDTSLTKLNEAGANGIFLQADTLAYLISTGRCIQKDNVYILPGIYDLDYLRNQFASIFGNNNVKIESMGSSLNISYNPNVVSRLFIESVPLGFSLNTISFLQSHNFNIIARIPYFKGCNEENIDLFIDYLNKYKINQVVFLGDTVLGFKSQSKYLAEKMNENKIFFGKIEFSDQKGSAVLAKENLTYSYWVHSITLPEMQGLNDGALIDRYTKAVRERGVRLIFLRFPESLGKDAFDVNITYIGKIKNNIEKFGYKVGEPKPVSEMPSFNFEKTWVAFGVGCFVFLIFNLLYKINYKKNIIFFILSLIISGLMSFMGGTLLKLLTLILGCVAPTFAILFTVKYNAKLKNMFLKVISCFVITFCGGLFNEALFSKTDYMVRNTIFAGIKLAHFIPLVLVAFILGFSIIENKVSIKESFCNFKCKFKELMKQPVLIGVVCLGIFLLVVVGLMLARSGNDSGMAVSALELKFRNILDKILFVRPRTKEFVLGYPCLLLGFWFLKNTPCSTLIKNSNKTVSYILLTIGTIGLVSLFNTFCHIHTPIFLAVIRSLNGLWVGVIIGVIILFILKNILKINLNKN